MPVTYLVNEPRNKKDNKIVAATITTKAMFRHADITKFLAEIGIKNLRKTDEWRTPPGSTQKQ